MAASTPTVVVTGAGGKTGGLIMDQLLADKEHFAARAVVRSPKSGARFAAAGAPVAAVDVASPDAQTALEAAFAGADAVVIATSAVPKIQKVREREERGRRRRARPPTRRPLPPHLPLIL